MVSLWIRSEPERLCLGTNVLAVLALKECLEVAEEIVLIWLAVLVLDVVGGVVVHAVEVVRSLYQGDLLGRELGETIAELLAHRVGVFAVVDGVGEPGDGEFKLAFGGLDILWVFWVPWINGVT